MRPLVLTALAVLALASPLAASTATISKTYPASDVRAIRIDFPAGNLDVVAGVPGQVAVTMSANTRGNCRRCARGLNDIRLVSDTRGGVLTFRLEGLHKSCFSRPSVRLRIAVPRDVDVDVAMGAGDLDVRAVDGDVRVKMGAGDIRLALAEQAVGAADVRVGVGDAVIRRGDEPMSGSGFLSKHLRWQGGGPSRLDVDLGVGDVKVALD